MSFSKLKIIYEVAIDIAKSDMKDYIKYQMIFSEKISRQVFDLCMTMGNKFEYCDSDASYIEDINEFIYALKDYIDENGSPENEELFIRYFNL